MRRLILALATLAPALALADEPLPFAGGELTITETTDGDKVLAFSGQGLARDWLLFFDREEEVAGRSVMLFSASAGGNACGADAVIVWKPDDGPVRGERFGDCGAPTPASDGTRLVFVPHVMPGDTAEVTEWTPESGFRLAGVLSFRPQPGTGWADLAASPPGHPVEFFDNSAFYAEAVRVLGDDLAAVATALSVSSEPEMLKDGFYHARGCIPHACTVNDGFVAVDVRAGKAWFAQMTDDGGFRRWPEGDWPADATAAFDVAFER
ncbi:MAG: hypothetical protein WAT70_08570 [Rhizobiaceae bacterium]